METLTSIKLTSGKGLQSDQGIDYEEAFAPISKITTLRTLMALGASKSWHFHQMDVQNAFLHGNMAPWMRKCT